MRENLFRVRILFQFQSMATILFKVVTSFNGMVARKLGPYLVEARSI